VAGVGISVTQAALACTYTLSRTSDQANPDGDQGEVSVTAPAACAWTASSQATWVHITSSASDSGNGKVTYTVDANKTEATRTGTLTIAGQTFTITQKKK
jgi:all-beta uncharacterized protein